MLESFLNPLYFSLTPQRSWDHNNPPVSAFKLFPEIRPFSPPPFLPPLCEPASSLTGTVASKPGSFLLLFPLLMSLNMAVRGVFESIIDVQSLQWLPFQSVRAVLRKAFLIRPLNFCDLPTSTSPPSLPTQTLQFPEHPVTLLPEGLSLWVLSACTALPPGTCMHG